MRGRRATVRRLAPFAAPYPASRSWPAEGDPDQALNQHRDQGVHEQGDDGMNFQHNPIGGRGRRQADKWRQKWFGDFVDEVGKGTLRVGGDQLQQDAQTDQPFENAKTEPDKL